MKLTAMCILAACLHAAARTEGQTITLSVRNKPLDKVLTEIKRQSKFSFVYGKELVRGAEPVTINVKDNALVNVLDQIFQHQRLTYKVFDDYIVLSPKPIEPTPESTGTIPNLPPPIDISGKVTDENGTPLIGATVMIKGTHNMTATNVDGTYALKNVGEDATLVVSYIGMETQEIKVKGKEPVSIVMKQAITQGRDVVVVGYGTQKKVNLTGAVSQVTGSVLNKRPVTDVSSMLQGVLPGVQVVQTNGRPSDGNSSITIRGLGTFSGAGANPLVLIDGVAGSLSNIDPNSIESVSVLKDAASASIYGSRAANGVILVTTKTGKNSDGKLRLEYAYNYGIHTPTKMLDPVTNSADYMKAWNTRITNSNYGVPIPGKQYTQADIDAYTNPTDKNLYPSFNWLDFLIKPAPTQMHNLSLSGGKQTYFNLSLNAVDEQGTLAPYSYKKYSAQLSLVSEISKKLKLGANTILKNGNSYGVANWNSSNLDPTNYFLCILAQPPTLKPTVADGSGLYSWRAYPFEENNWNPYFTWKEVPGSNINYVANQQIWADFEIIDGLHWYTKFAANYSIEKDKGFVAFQDQYEHLYRDVSVLGYGNNSFLQQDTYDELYKNFFTYLTYEKAIKSHRFNLMLGYSNENDQVSNMSAYRGEYKTNLTPELNAGAEGGQTNGGTSAQWAIQSVFGRLNYRLKDKYLLELNVRADGTSRLAAGNRWGVFPSVSAGWVFTNEAFIANAIPWLSSGKVRGSWGVLGNQNIGNYPYQALLSFTGTYPFDNASLSQGVAQTALNNPNIKWETTTSSNIGADLLLFNKLALTVEVYKKYTTDILRTAQVNDLVGLTAPVVNSGAMQNTGVEFDLKYNDNIKSGILNGLKWGAGLNFTHNNNKLVKFGADQINSRTIYREGLPWNTFYLLQADGIFQSKEEIAASPKQFGENTQPGTLKYKDVSGPNGKPDGVIDNYDRIPMTKGVFPALIYGFNLNAEWKGFDLFGFFQGVAGSKVYVTGWGVQPFVQGSAPTKKQYTEAWTPENHSTTMVQLGDPISYNHPSTYLLRDNSYLRLKTLQVGYSLPYATIKQLYLKNLRVYFAGDNLITFTKYEGLDPERSGNGSFVNYPQSKVFSFGVKATF
ncbi:TonB-dependent receptor [Chitinophaga eiseniae]|uniref:TonB-dependent receptor n=1 Tax=Chitinophaga eiseniae TaxID=634771 RepID=A0A847SIT6_9BACT|nr:TonB-dependent receptor [Chitinophaga eiseniae]NLR79663.1 TonB-dependent receptor [Chitinophaga eiseniae]